MSLNLKSTHLDIHTATCRPCSLSSSDYFSIFSAGNFHCHTSYYICNKAYVVWFTHGWLPSWFLVCVQKFYELPPAAYTSQCIVCVYIRDSGITIYSHHLRRSWENVTNTYRLIDFGTSKVLGYEWHYIQGDCGWHQLKLSVTWHWIFCTFQ